MAHFGTVGSPMFALGCFLQRGLNYVTVDSTLNHRMKQSLESVELAMKRSRTAVRNGDTEDATSDIGNHSELTQGSSENLYDLSNPFV